MRINELIVEQELDEGLGQAIGKAWGGAMKGVGAVGGGIAGSWDAMKQGYRAGKAAVAGRENPDDADPTLTKNKPDPNTQTQQPAAGGSQQPAANNAAPTAGGTAPAPAASSSELDQLKATLGKLNPDQKKELAGELEKSMNAPAAQAAPAQGQSAGQPGAAPAQGQPAAQPSTAPAMTPQEKNAADAAERDKQIAATKASNAAAAQADNQLVAAVKAAKAKPAFQQTASDKLTIKQGAAKGIHESKKKKKKKVVAEFNSRFLGMKI